MSNSKLTLWKENKKDQEWSMSYDEIGDKFRKSDYFVAVSKGGYSLEYGLKLFLSQNDGLNSVFDEEPFQDLFEEIRASLLVAL